MYIMFPNGLSRQMLTKHLRKVKTTLNLIFTKIFREYHLTSSECTTNYETFLHYSQVLSHRLKNANTEIKSYKSSIMLRLYKICCGTGLLSTAKQS